MAAMAMLMSCQEKDGNQDNAAKMRLRPILMTSLTMIFGMLPLMFASGAGANGSRTVGVGTVGGMLIGTLGLLFVVPALFVLFQTLQERFKPVEFVDFLNIHQKGWEKCAVNAK